MKRQLLINGVFTEFDLKEIESELKQYEIQVYGFGVKGLDLKEIVRIVFRDFDAFILIRDGFLFETLTKIYQVLR